MKSRGMALRVLIAGVLFLAASMKSYDFIVNFRGANGHGLAAYFNLALAEVELALCVLLVGNFYQKAVHRILMVLFAAFSVKSAHSLWIGLHSCGCLGAQVTIPPLVSLIFDVVILGALIWEWRSRPRPTLSVNAI